MEIEFKISKRYLKSRELKIKNYILAHLQIRIAKRINRIDKCFGQFLVSKFNVVIVVFIKKTIKNE